MPTHSALPFLVVDLPAVASHTHDWLAYAAESGWDVTRFMCRVCHCLGRRRWERRGFRGEATIECEPASERKVVAVSGVAPATEVPSANESSVESEPWWRLCS